MALTAGDLKSIEAIVGAFEVRLTSGLEGRFGGLEGRFGKLEGGFEGLEGGFEGLEGRFEGLENRLVSLEERIDGVELNLTRKMERMELRLVDSIDLLQRDLEDRVRAN